MDIVNSRRQKIYFSLFHCEETMVIERSKSTVLFLYHRMLQLVV